MERMDGARRLAGAGWVLVGLIIMCGWALTGPGEPPGPITWAVVGSVAIGAVVQVRAGRAVGGWWGGRMIGVVVGVELLGAVGDRFGLLGGPGAPGVSWGDWAHFRAETAQLVPWHSLVEPAAVAATVVELTLGTLLLVGVWWRWVGKAVAGLFVVYLVAMVPGTGPTSVLTYGVPVLVGGALLASARGPRPAGQGTAHRPRAHGSLSRPESEPSDWGGSVG